MFKKFFSRKKSAPRPLAEIPDQTVELVPDREEEPSFDEARLAHPLRVFEQYNANKRDFLYDQLPHRKKLVYDLIPLLIHIQADDLLPARDACKISPCGVYGFEITPLIAQGFAEAFPGRSLPAMKSRPVLDPSLPVKSISLIGSLGSIAQNSKSDFDYWICIEGDTFSRESRLYFEEKLRAIDQWADTFGGAEVHCFPLDLVKVRRNDFGSAGGESSGTAQGKILKEEFYRSLTLVCGQVPLWWAMPPGVSDQEYSSLSALAAKSKRIDASRLVDMGNVYNISLGEFYGAAIWQINKTIGSPFKSVLKMALLEEYMINHGSKGLLADDLKSRLLANENDANYLDPYVIMFQRASDYLVENNRLDDLDLLRRSLYLKAGAQLSLADHRRADLPRKKQVMVNLIRNWGWNHKMVEKLNDYHHWSSREAQRFSDEINRFVLKTYKRVTKELASQKQESDLKISQRDLTVLGRKLYIFFSERTNKISSIKSVIEDPPALSSLTIQPRLDSPRSKVWDAYRGFLSRDAVEAGQGWEKMLASSPYLTELLTWLVTNKLYDESTSINLNAGAGRLATHCTVPDLQNLLRQIKEFFPNLKLSEIKEDDLLSKPKLVRMFLVINLDETDRADGLVETGLIYQNSWGEVFFKGFSRSDDGIKIGRDFVRKHFAYDPVGLMTRFKVFMPERHFKKSLGPRLNKYFGTKIVS
ncbi:MAG: class I adenylate cyclase [Proteobacteria bacterium]|nr:class I adenylate cyclase [Pseudomonadota bacterium]